MIAGLVTYREMLNVVGTARKVDYWTTRGYIHAVERATTKSGFPRQWPIAERDIAREMERLVTAGITVEVAAVVARAVIETGMPEASIGDGITLLLERR